MKNRKSMITAVLAMTVVAGALAFSPMDVRAAETFDPVFYAATYADVAAAFGTDANALYNHYINYGRSEGRKAYAGAVGGEEVSGATGTGLSEFDPVFYAETYPDIVAVLGTDANALYNHYINYGRSEGRKAYAGAVGGEAVRSSVSDNIAKITNISNKELGVLANYPANEWVDFGDWFLYIYQTEGDLTFSDPSWHEKYWVLIDRGYSDVWDFFVYFKPLSRSVWGTVAGDPQSFYDFYNNLPWEYSAR